MLIITIRERDTPLGAKVGEGHGNIIWIHAQGARIGTVIGFKAVSLLPQYVHSRTIVTVQSAPIAKFGCYTSQLAVKPCPYGHA